MKQLTTDGSEDIINGTSDWNNHEEFGLADCFQWSPDGRRIAYYQFDQSGVPEFALINYTDTLYPVITKYKYPMPGQTNSAVRLGVVSAGGGATRWFQTPGDPRNTYIPYMEWTSDNQVILQHMNRLQNTNTVYLANPDTGALRQMFQDKNDTWVEVNRNHALDRGRQTVAVHQRARRMASSLRDLPRGRCAPDHQRAFRYGLAGSGGRTRGLGVLHRLAGECDPALPVPRPPRWKPDRTGNTR